MHPHRGTKMVRMPRLLIQVLPLTLTMSGRESVRMSNSLKQPSIAGGIIIPVLQKVEAQRG